MSNDLIPRQAVLDICEEIGQKREWLVASEEIAKAVGEVACEAITDEMVGAGAQAMIVADTPDGPSYVNLARACLTAALTAQTRPQGKDR